MATKTPTKAAPTEDQSPNTESPPKKTGENFLKQNFPHEKGETVQVTHVYGNGYRVNVRGNEPSGLPGLNIKRLVSSKFVLVDMSEVTPTIRYAVRQ